MGAIFGCVGAADAGNSFALISSALRHRGAAERWTGRDSFMLGARHHPGASAESVVGRSGAQGSPDVHVVFEGTIVNAGALWAELGERDSSGHEAALIARLYVSSGVRLFEKLRGMFAIAIWDAGKQQLILARDPLGQKSILYSQTSRGFFFASECKALLAARVIPFDVDAMGLSHFLSFRFIPPPHTMLKGVEKVPAAHYVTLQQDKLTHRRYWSLSFGSKFSTSEDALVDALEEKLKETVGAYLVDRADVGAFLSAGLDSGLLVAYISEHLRRSFPTFSLGVRDESDEMPGARLVAQRFGTKQHELYPDDDLVRLLPEIVWALDEPSDTVSVSKFLIARMAASHVRWAVSGDGGDELFAGFPRFLGVRDSRLIALIPGILRDALISPVARALGGLRDHKNLFGKILWMTEVSAGATLGDRYAKAVNYLRYDHQAKRALFTPELWREIAGADSDALLARKVLESDAADSIEKLLQTEIQTRLPEHLLMMDDRTGGAHGVEILCPLADKELMEFAAQIPIGLKIKGRKAKYIERQVAERVLPPDVARLRKTGFSFPFGSLCATTLQPFLRNVVSDSRLVEAGLFRREPLSAMIADQGAGRVDHHVRIWLFLNVEIWYRLMETNLGPDSLKPWMERSLQGSPVT
jgi:asparagine synthase (glutamine-hydrolysing)